MSESVPPPLPVKLPKTWWERYWMWVAIVGGVALLVAIIGGSMAGMNFITGKLRESEPYRFAMSTVQQDATVAAALGSPITATKMISGNFNKFNDQSFINLAIPISGPKGSGVLQVVASKTDGDWSYSTLQVFVADTKQVIPLRKAE
jgi:hypothetical protein